MTSLPPSDLSLYELALQGSSPSSVLQVSPPALKSVLDSWLQLLIAEAIPAIIWAKLPRDRVWQTTLDQYVNLADVPIAIYRFQNSRDELEDGGVDSEQESSRDLGGAAASSTSMISLPPDSQLRREYFLIIWSSRFCGAFLAHRPRSGQLPKSATIPVSSLELLGSSGQMISVPEEPADRRQLLLATCTFQPEQVQALVMGLVPTVMLMAATTVDQVGGSEPMPAGLDLPDRWQQQLANLPINHLDWGCLSRLFLQQSQYQEELWQRGNAFRKQAEGAEALRLQNEDLLNTLRLKDEFLNNVGQELRTPLTTIKTALKLLNSPSIKPPQRQRYMDLIEKECDRQSSLITSLLDLVQLEQTVDQTALPPLNVADVVPGVVSTYQPLAEEKGVRLAYTVPDDLPRVACMNNWLRQIVINLLHNGIKFTPEGGQVWVKAKQQGDYVQLEFRDTGIGIASSEIPKIFDRFYRVRQVNEDASGAGLGLTIVQQLLLHCGGSISVKSKVSEGSVFNVLLPIHKQPSENQPS